MVVEHLEMVKYFPIRHLSLDLVPDCDYAAATLPGGIAWSRGNEIIARRLEEITEDESLEIKYKGFGCDKVKEHTKIAAANPGICSAPINPPTRLNKQFHMPISSKRS
jgi:hypothetical protein